MRKAQAQAQARPDTYYSSMSYLDGLPDFDISANLEFQQYIFVLAQEMEKYNERTHAGNHALPAEW